MIGSHLGPAGATPGSATIPGCGGPGISVEGIVVGHWGDVRLRYQDDGSVRILGVQLSARPEIIESTFDRVKYGLTT